MTQIKLDAPKKTFFMHVPGTRMVIIGWALVIVSLLGAGTGSLMTPAAFIGGVILISVGHAIRTFSKRELS